MSSITSGIGSLADAEALIAKVASLVSNDATLASGSTASNLFPVRTFGTPNRIALAGMPEVEATFHKMMVPGSWLESHMGEAMGSLLKAQNDRQNAITQYLDLNRLAVTTKLPLYPRIAKVAIDCIHFMRQVQTYLTNIQGYIFAMQANMALLLEMERRMATMVTQNEALLSALLNDVCNWHLPALPSMPVQLASLLNWGGFNFNKLSGFNLPTLQSLTIPNFNQTFSFSSCVLRTPDLSSLFSSATPTSATVLGSTVTQVGGYVLPLGAIAGVPADYTEATYIATMQATTAIVIDPDTFNPVTNGSLPDPTSIISNYALTPAQYAANVVSLVPGLLPSLTTPSLIAQLSSNILTLEEVVASGYDPNTTAAWLMYLQLNKMGRAGTWVSPFSTEFLTSITPSINYLTANDVPYNKVLGGPGVSNAPSAIPFIATLKAQTTNNLLWRLSFVEAALLGYARCTLWDSAADTTYLTGITGSSPDYVASTGDLTSLSTQILGADTASYPVSCSYPTAIAANLATVISAATLNIAGASSYQSVRPQNRYTYTIFADAVLVDKYSQFWRDFNSNLQTLLTADPYLVAFVVQNSTILNEAINPLATGTDYTALSTDALSRNRNWIPGSSLLPVPAALAPQQSSVPPTIQSSGWNGGTFDATTFLARPDIQAQTIPVQVAMLRLNQSYADMLTTQAAVSQVVSDMQAAVTAATQNVASSGWEVETSNAQVVAPGTTYIMSFEDVVFDQGDYVDNLSTIEVSTASAFAITGQVNWDPTGDAGPRTVVVMQNGSLIESQSNDPGSSEGFDLSFSIVIQANVGDTFQIGVSHSLQASQSVISANFLGLMDPTATTADTTKPPNPSVTLGLPSSITAVAGNNFTEPTAVFVQADGTVAPVAVTQATSTPAITVDGVVLSAASTGSLAPLAQSYGVTYMVPGASFTPGDLLYVAADGTLTNDYSSIISMVHWVLVVGKAVTPTSFIYQPQLPVFQG